MKNSILGIILTLILSTGFAQQSLKKEARPPGILQRSNYEHYINQFNQNDKEQAATYIPNAQTWNWLQDNIPFFDCSDKQLEEMYYFRWWTFRKHIRQTPDGFVITEFLPDVHSAGEHNTSPQAASQHFYEGRWLRDRKFLKNYAYSWFKKTGESQTLDFAPADAIRAWAMVTLDQQLGVELFPDLLKNFEILEQEQKDNNGLFRSGETHDIDPAINSRMYGEAMALGTMCIWRWRFDETQKYRLKAAQLREQYSLQCWNRSARFFMTKPSNGVTPVAKELSGYLPWYFNMPDKGHEDAWKYLNSTKSFYAPFGPLTKVQPLTGEQQKAVKPSSQSRPEENEDLPWPSAISQTLTGMANLLNNYRQAYVGKSDYFTLLRKYAAAHYRRGTAKMNLPYLGENFDPLTGRWFTFSELSDQPVYASQKSVADTGRYCNNSTFNDLIITGLVGLRPREDYKVEINPLVPENALDYFCLDAVRYHGSDLTILWDRTGNRYHKGKGLRVFADGQQIGYAPALEWMIADLPETHAGWTKYENNPLIGQGRPSDKTMGGVNDVEVRFENGKYRLWCGRSGYIAVSESTDGIHWTDPENIFPPDSASGWEEEVSRPTIVKREDGYHIWYTGQVKDKWRIGYATSPDGIHWKRMSSQPVLKPDQPWEGTAVMCPNVIWDSSAQVYKMWYSAGFRGAEPFEIGYATSSDGLHWTKYGTGPVFAPNPANVWEQQRVTGCQVFRKDGWYYMAYIGFRGDGRPAIGLARSKDGITGWERHKENPIIRPGKDQFDQDACFKPVMIFAGKKWLLWYNGYDGIRERVGLALHPGEDLGF